MIDHKENTKLKGSIDLKLFGPSGELKETRYIPNLVVQSGKNYIATRILGTTAGTLTTASGTSCMITMAVGTSTTTATVNDNTLGAEVTANGDIAGAARATISAATASTGVVTYVATFATNNPQRTNTSNTTAITEAGIFNQVASGGGTMLCRTTFNPVNKGNDDTLQITWTITVS